MTNLYDISLDEPLRYHDFPSFTIHMASYYVINQVGDGSKIISYYDEKDKLVATIHLLEDVIKEFYFDSVILEEACQKCLHQNGFRPSSICIKGNQNLGYHLEYYNTYGMKITSHILHTLNGQRPSEKMIKKSNLKGVIEYNQKNRQHILDNDDLEIGKYLIKTLEKQKPDNKWILDNTSKIKYLKNIIEVKKK